MKQAWQSSKLMFPVGAPPTFGALLVGAAMLDLEVQKLLQAGNKLVVCVLGALASIGGSVAAWRWWGHRGAAAVTGMLFALSPLHLSVSSEFVKNAAGTAVLAWLLAALAGSERSDKTGAEAGGKRFSEGCSINFALTALGQVERRWGRQFAYVQICTQICTQICIQSCTPSCIQICIGAVVAQAFFRDAL